MLAAIGGTGIDEMEGLTGARCKRATSPFGEPSDPILIGELEGNALVTAPECRDPELIASLVAGRVLRARRDG